MNTKSVNSGWIFDFRTNPCYSDTDSECDNDELSQIASNTVNELNSIDLFTREENISYKPSPFSIAKINAAYRAKPNHISSTVSRTSGLSKGSSKPKSVQSTIMDGFKTQALKKKPPKSQPRKMSATKVSGLESTTSEPTLAACLESIRHPHSISSNALATADDCLSPKRLDPTTPAAQPLSLAVDLRPIGYKMFTLLSRFLSLSLKFLLLQGACFSTSNGVSCDPSTYKRAYID